MTKKSRYLLIVAGFIIFLLLAPVIVLYVRGISYNFSTKSFVKTGILAVSMQPSQAQIFLDGKLKRNSQGDIAFLTPGQYQVQIQKSGYQPWSKRLIISPGVVTWASPAYNSIYLFLSSPPQKTFASSVLDFYSQGNSVTWLTADDITTASVQNPKQSTSYLLPKPVNQIAGVDGPGKNFILVNSNSSRPTILVFNSASGQFSDISALFPAIPQMEFSGDGSLYSLSAGVLYKVDLAQLTKTPLFSGVRGFYFLGNSLYFVQSAQGVYSLNTSEQPFLASQTLLTGLPALNSANLFVNYGKQIFLLSGGSLYLANNSMQKLVDGVAAENFSANDTAIPVLQNGELDYYDTLGQNLNFVTRSSQALSSPVIRTDIGYAFFIQNNRLQAIELDTRDTQNQYVLYSGVNLQKYSIDSAGKNVLVLDNGELKNLTIR